MSGQGDQDGLVARWSRLKRESARREKEARARDEAPDRDRRATDAERAAAMPGDARAADTGAEAPFDPATLPPLDSIVAGSDIRAFLQKGVPAELATAALRRAWTMDPAIRDFIGIAENQWDFTDPATIPGFGPIEPGSDLRALVAQALGEVADAPAPMSLTNEEPGAACREETAAVCASPDPEAPPALPEQGKPDDRASATVAASQHPRSADADRGVIARPRGHGGALPR